MSRSEEIAEFVEESGEASHYSSTNMLSSRIALMDKKKAGENVPGTWKPS